MSMRRGLAALVLALVAGMTSTVWAGQRPAPRIDPLTASIRGRITTLDSGAPIRRAEVRAVAPGGFTRMATTDGDGRFTLRDVPAGEYRIHVSRTGFVPLAFGQRRPFEAATPIVVKEGDQVTANVALPRAGAITGRVTDQAGEPLAGARVQALRQRTIEGARQLAPAGTGDVTDDTGSFRVYGLPPGDYYVSVVGPEPHVPQVPRGALPGEMPPTANALRRMRSPARVFYPGTPSLQQAVPIPVGVGGETRADIQILSSYAATVSGTIVDSAGAPVADALISLQSALVSTGEAPLAITGHAAADGTFALQDVPPGPYSLQVTGSAMSVRMVDTPGGQMPMMSGEFAVVPLTVTDSDVGGLVITTGPPMAIDVTVTADSTVTRPLPRDFNVSARAVSRGGHVSFRSAGTGTFRLILTGPSYIQVENLPDEWAVKAITMNGTDITDQAVQPRSGTADVRVILTDRVTEVTGSLSAAAGGSAADARASVVVFPADVSKRRYPSRYLRTVRTDDTGAFRITGLPGNERYLAVAVDHLEDGEGSDPEFLDSIQEKAAPFTLGDSERKTVSIPLVRR